jgi:hypothetical protein
MSFLAFETTSSHARGANPVHSRRNSRDEDRLILTELDAHAIVDHLDDDDAPINLTTCGSVREACPKCAQPHLKLVLRQRSVRTAHLFCAACQGCFDAHYANGASALTI